MIVISRKEAIRICLVIIFLIIISIIMLIKYYNGNKDKIIINYNSAVLKSSSNIVEEQQENVEENSINVEIKKPEEIDANNVAIEITKLNNLGWDYQKNNLGDDYVADKLNCHYEKFSITRDNDRIIRIIFNENYENEVAGGVYVGMDFDEVKDILGEPTFESSENNMIGYATKRLFLCIYENEIAVYQNKYYSNRELEESINKYYKGEYDGNANDFSRYIRSNYDDFKFTSDEDRNIYLTSQMRGIVIKLDDSIKVKLYYNYDNSQLFEEDMLENIEYIEQYMVELMEDERNSER